MLVMAMFTVQSILNQGMLNQGILNQGILNQGGQKTLESLGDPKKPWIFFAPGKIPWKTMKLQPSPEKLCSEADFRVKILGLAILLRFLFAVDPCLLC